MKTVPDGGNIDLDLINVLSTAKGKEERLCLNIEEQIDHWRTLSARRAPCPRLNLLAARLLPSTGWPQLIGLLVRR